MELYFLSRIWNEFTLIEHIRHFLLASGGIKSIFINMLCIPIKKRISQQLYLEIKMEDCEYILKLMHKRVYSLNCQGRSKKKLHQFTINRGKDEHL